MVVTGPVPPPPLLGPPLSIHFQKHSPPLTRLHTHASPWSCVYNASVSRVLMLMLKLFNNTLNFEHGPENLRKTRLKSHDYPKNVGEFSRSYTGLSHVISRVFMSCFSVYFVQNYHQFLMISSSFQSRLIRVIKS